MYFFFSLYFIVNISHFDHLSLSHELHIFSLYDTDNIEKNDIEGRCIYNNSRQNKSVKSGMDVRLEFEFKKNIPANTTAYCLITHDRVIEYSPMSSVIRKLRKLSSPKKYPSLLFNV